MEKTCLISYLCAFFSWIFHFSLDPSWPSAWQMEQHIFTWILTTPGRSSIWHWPPDASVMYVIGPYRLGRAQIYSINMLLLPGTCAYAQMCRDTQLVCWTCGGVNSHHIHAKSLKYVKTQIFITVSAVLLWVRFKQHVSQQWSEAVWVVMTWNSKRNAFNAWNVFQVCRVLYISRNMLLIKFIHFDRSQRDALIVIWRLGAQSLWGSPQMNNNPLKKLSR